LLRVREYVENEDAFCFTYGDGVSDVNIDALVRFHHEQGRLATVTAVQPPGRFGSVDIEGQRIKRFEEKPQGDGSWINGGYFVLSPYAIDHIANESTMWEKEPLEQLAVDRQLSAWRHHGFWQPMDTLRDKIKLDELWQADQAPWKVWL
jgi:glucose-1-phosphate cytidylyltransferase